MEAGLAVRANQDFGSNRLEAAVLDLVADDGTGMQKQKSHFHWDKRSKKYVKLNSGERVTASGKIKTESGAKVKANKTGIYKKWKQQSHNKISLKGTSGDGNREESTSMSGDRRMQGNNRKFKGSKRQNFEPNAHVRSETKDLEQVRKERQKKANKISHMQNKSGKGKKFNRNGKRGKPKSRPE